jgi:hypothetical protein
MAARNAHNVSSAPPPSWWKNADPAHQGVESVYYEQHVDIVGE